MEFDKTTISSGSSSVNDEKQNAFSVLVVDDDRVVRTIHKTMLRQQGVEVHLAVNGHETVQFHRAGSCFDLILMDFHMPVMNGYQATRMLRDMGVNSAIVGVTTCTAAERKMFMESGLDDCISKPLTLDKIASYIPMAHTTAARDESEDTTSGPSYAGQDDDFNSSSNSNC